MLIAAVAWAFAWGAHEHGAPGVAADLSGYGADRVLEVDVAGGAFDLSSVQVVPGEVLDIHLMGSAGQGHAFVFTGASAGAEMDQRLDPSGDTVVRLRVPESGAVSFLCTIPGHEEINGTLVVNAGQ
jgi:plastocyanin